MFAWKVAQPPRHESHHERVGRKHSCLASHPRCTARQLTALARALLSALTLSSWLLDHLVCLTHYVNLCASAVQTYHQLQCPCLPVRSTSTRLMPLLQEASSALSREPALATAAAMLVPPFSRTCNAPCGNAPIVAPCSNQLLQVFLLHVFDTCRAGRALFICV